MIEDMCNDDSTLVREKITMTEKTVKPLWSETDNRDVGMKKTHHVQEMEDYKTRLGLLYKVSQKAGSASQLSQLTGKITRMTQNTLNAAASSVLLLDEQKQELVFEVAEGPAGKHLRKVRLGHQSGIAGWVVQHGKPLLVNDVYKDMRFNRDVDKTTDFNTKSIICAPLIVRSQCIGVIEVLNKVDGSAFTAHDLETLVSVASTAAITIENLRLNQAILDSYKSTIKALAAAIDAKDHYTRGHSRRVTEYALMGATALSLSKEEFEDIEYAGILHDIGKIGIADSILTKPGPLNVEERDIVCRHPLIGASMLIGIPFLEKARILILQHHERYDGQGYPYGIKGEAMPIGARLLAVADAFDAMVTERPYRAALGVDYAINELYRCMGTQFCPDAVKAFIAGFHMNDKTHPSTPKIPEPGSILTADKGR